MGLDSALYNIISLSLQTDRQGNKTEGKEIINHMAGSFIAPYCASLLCGWTSLVLHHRCAGEPLRIPSSTTLQNLPSVTHIRSCRATVVEAIVVLTKLNEGLD